MPDQVRRLTLSEYQALVAAANRKPGDPDTDWDDINWGGGPDEEADD